MATGIYGYSPVVQVSSGEVMNNRRFGGSNFQATPVSSNFVQISFTPPFGSRPTVIANAYTSANYVVVSSVAADKCLIYMSNPNIIFYFAAFGAQGSYPITSTRYLASAAFRPNPFTWTASTTALSGQRTGTGNFQINLNNIASLTDYCLLCVPHPPTQDNWTPVSSTNYGAFVVNPGSSSLTIQTGILNGGTFSAADVGIELFILINAVSNNPPIPSSIIFGSLDSSSNIKSGDGFTSFPTGTSGTFDLSPFAPFANRPAFVMSINFPGDDSFGAQAPPLNTLPVVQTVTSTQVEFATGPLSSNQASEFVFICM